MPWDENTYIPCWKIEAPDVWNFDDTLALFIADGFELFAANEASGNPSAEDLHKHAKTFRDYATDSFKSGQRSVELDEAIDFLKDNFHRLWN